jgi:transcriptional regulator with XRE-family HTH domain
MGMSINSGQRPDGRAGARGIPVASRRRLGAEIRRRRVATGLSQHALGTPMTRAYVSAVELGRVCPSLPSLVLFARRLGVPVSQLLMTLDDGSDSPGPGS